MANLNYHYTPLSSLESTRVLYLYPAKTLDAPLKCKIVEVRIHGSPSFEALSYVWGDRQSQDSIIVERSRSQNSRILGITTNCADALRRLRYRFFRRVLWVDAICIDQSSVTDRNQQVPLMTKIYAKASTVLVWLGEGTEEQKFKEIFYLINGAGRLYRLRQLRIEAKPPTSSLEFQIANDIRCFRREVLLFFLNPYFQRVWTVQEVAVARRIVFHGSFYTATHLNMCIFEFFTRKKMGFYGDWEWLPDSEIRKFSDILSTRHYDILGTYLSSHLIELDEMRIYELERNGKVVKDIHHLCFEILTSVKALETTELRDKAYAMLWAFRRKDKKEDKRPLFQVNYLKPVSVVFTEFMEVLLEELPGRIKLIPLCLVPENKASQMHDLPSWVPDFSQSESYGEYLGWALLSHSNLLLKSVGEDDFKFRIDGSRLLVTGSIYSRVKWGIYCQTTNITHHSLLSDQGQNMRNAQSSVILWFRDIFLKIEELSADQEQNDRFLGSVYHMFLYYLKPGVSRPVLGAIEGKGVKNQKEMKKILNWKQTIVENNDEWPRNGSYLDEEWTERERALSEERCLSIGLLRIQVLRELINPVITRPESHAASLRRESMRSQFETFLDSYLPLHESEKVLIDFDEYMQQLPPEPDKLNDYFLQLDRFLYSLAPYIGTYNLYCQVTALHCRKTVFFTERGDVGLAYSTLPGDVISLWDGCSIPMIMRMRTADEDSDTWTLVGPAYIERIMFGQAEGLQLDHHEFTIV